ncbi:MAG: RnfABCDGE type electron transport complex subunit G [Spirochaetaceae bacterium]|jgi:electron transport complex protein RnfG|nr:RnfABCDGE type electron transport complex subunit G [Spirochaetaceae bacterium]
MKDTLKMVAAIVIFAVIACSGLAVVYQKTKPTIDDRKEKDLNNALAELFPQATSNELLKSALESPDSSVKIGDVYKVEQNGKTIGLAVNASSGGFQADITILVGIESDGKITGIKILQQSETPGLGANASKKTYFVDKSTKTTFYEQFAGKTVSDAMSVTKDGGDIIAITAATITSRAVTKIVKNAAEAGAKWLSSNANAAPAAQDVQGGVN